MVAEDRYRIDVVRQVQAARSALSSLETLIIDDHVDTCVHALEAGETGERRAKVTELVSILTGKKKTAVRGLLLTLGCLTSIATLARPVSYTGGWTAIGESDGNRAGARSLHASPVCL